MSSETSNQETQPYGRYYPEYVQVASGNDVNEQLRDALDAAERKEWHLVGVAGGLADNGVILFWDTARPSFGRRDHR